MASRYTGEKPRVRKNCFPYTGEYCWQAARPGDSYIVDGGLHFRSWQDALNYALEYWEQQEDERNLFCLPPEQNTPTSR